MGSIWHGAIRAQNVGSVLPSEKNRSDQFWYKCKMKGKLEQTAIGRRRRRTKKSLNLSRTAVTCVVKGNCCVGHTKR